MAIENPNQYNWIVVYDSEEVQVLVTTIEFEEDSWRVRDNKTGHQTYFRGETAWQDARRFAADIDFGAWSIT